jgi:hypothetical protein
MQLEFFIEMRGVNGNRSSPYKLRIPFLFQEMRVTWLPQRGPDLHPPAVDFYSIDSYSSNPLQSSPVDEIKLCPG